MFLAPFVLILIGDIIGSNIPLYTFGLSLKDFFTMWTAIFGVFGIVYNIYQNQRRISQQEKQLDGQSKQIEYQNMQLELQAKSERNSRFAKGVELLGSNQESARTGGVYNLIFLAKEYPNEFKETVFNILCSHIRSITSINDYKKEFNLNPSNEIQTLMLLLFNSDDNFFSDLEGDLSNAYLAGIKLTGANLFRANLSYTNLIKADLSEVNMSEADLSRANLSNALLINTDMSRANLHYI